MVTKMRTHPRVAGTARGMRTSFSWPLAGVPMVHPRKLGALLVVSLGACAHPVAPNSPSAVSPPPPPTPERRSPSPTAPTEEARALRTSAACEGFARSHVSVPDVAFEVLDACTRREDFTEVRPFLREPWLGITKRKGLAGLWSIARVLARTPATQAVDLELLRDSGLNLWPLKGAEEQPHQYPRRAVYFHGKIREDAGRFRVVDVVHAAGREYSPSVRR